MLKEEKERKIEVVEIETMLTMSSPELMTARVTNQTNEAEALEIT